MADGVVLNAGSGGVTAATDDCGAAGHTQVVKLAVSNDGVATAIPADTGNGLDVDVTRIVPGTGATNLGKAEDVAAAGGDTGVAVLTVRQDTITGDTSADNDYQMVKSDSVGRIYVNASGVAVPITDNAGSLTVDGTVTVQDGGGAISIDDNAGSITVDGSVTANAGTNLNTSALALEAGGNLAAQTTSLQLIDDVVYAEDIAAQAADKGVAVLAVRRDANTSLVGTDNDYANLQVDATGSLKVAIISGAGSGGTAMVDDAAFTVAVTSFTPMGGIVTSDSVDSGDGGAFAMLANRQQKVTLYDSGGVELSVGGGTQYAEDAPAAANPVGNALIVVREDARAGTLVSADGDNVALRGNNLGELYVKHTDNITVNSHAVTNAGTFAVQATIAAGATNIAKAEDVASADADVGVPTMAVRKATPANTSGTDGDYEFLQISAGRLWASATVDAALPAGNNNIGDVDIVTLPASTNTLEVVGDVAHDAAAAGNPVLIAGRANSNIEGITQVASGDSTYITTDLNGCIVTRPYTTPGETLSDRVANTDGSSTAFTNLGAGGGSVRNYLTSITIWNSSATDGFVDIRDGTAGAVLATFPAPQTGGCHCPLPVPLRGSTNTALAYDVSGAISTVYITAIGYQAL